MRVRVSGAPGYPDFEASVLPGLHLVRRAEGYPEVSVLWRLDALGNVKYFVIESRYVTKVSE